MLDYIGKGKKKRECTIIVKKKMNFELSVASKLLAVGLIELDEHDDVLFSWQYPDIEDSLRELITGISHIKKVNFKLLFFFFFVFIKH